MLYIYEQYAIEVCKLKRSANELSDGHGGGEIKALKLQKRELQH